MGMRERQEGWTALRIIAYQPGSLTGGRQPQRACCVFLQMLLPVSKLLIIRCVHCETQHYVLFTHTLYPFLYLCKDYHSELGKSISAYSLAVQFKGGKKRESSQVPASLGGHQLIHNHPQRSFPRSFSGRMSPSYLSPVLIGFQCLRTGGSSPLPPE